MDDLPQAQFFFETGIDTEILLTPCLLTRMSQEKWLADNDVPACMMCGTQFGFSNRRHHCRRCGRVFCAVCCPEAEFRACLICVPAKEIDERLQSPQLYEINQFLDNPKLMSLLNQPDEFLRSELLRCLQNSLRNNRTRDQFLKYFGPMVLQSLLEYYTAALKTQSPLFTTIIGIFVNFTATAQPHYAGYLHECNVPVALLASLNQPLPLQTQILIFHALRNVSYCFQAAKQISEFPGFYQVCFQVLQTGAIRAQEFILAIFGNILRVSPESSKQILPIEPIQGICKSSQIVQVCTQLLFEKNQSAQIMSMRLIVMLFQSEVAALIIKTELLKNISRLFKESEFVQMAAMFSTFQILIEIGRIHKKQKDNTVCLFNKNVVQNIVECLQSDNAVTSRSAAAVLHAMAEIDSVKLCTALTDLQQQFVGTVKGLLENEQFYDVSEHLVECVILLEKSENEVGKAIKQSIGDLEGVL
ncbi:FYVE_zinc finger domain-containing protein [Hexamita inflata]|uniref:FYVE zinc finger domain-containing protein n=1 Tax=Hexamita inflata TaxID=28002 RepID=A0AA86NYW4_9EUKA|nr:FYVE zinc finger domain-containing protein [Hexamita inflata]